MTDGPTRVTAPMEDARRIRQVIRDGAPQWELRCPGCGQWGDIDDDQAHGRVSVHHDDPACGYHETHDFVTEEGA